MDKSNCKPASSVRMRRILIVEDETNQAYVLRLGLRKVPNCEVVTAISGEQALRLFQREPFDLMITDYQMQGMNGMTLIEQVRKDYPATATMLLTAYSSTELHEQASQVLVHRLLDKPVGLEEFRAAVLEALEAPVPIQARNAPDQACVPSVPSIDPNPEAQAVDTDVLVSRILIVEEDPSNSLLLHAALQKLNHCEVVSAASGEQALEFLWREPFDLLITAYDLPGMDGMQLVWHVRESYPAMPVIFITGFSNPDLHQQAKRANVAAILDKYAEFTQIRSAAVHALRDKAAAHDLQIVR
ncbi:MAG: response regulator [Chloroflexi bacterium]|nr:response regulator [Chloroflexota bacterium]